jgi:hypothetical protein
MSVKAQMVRPPHGATKLIYNGTHLRPLSTLALLVHGSAKRGCNGSPDQPEYTLDCIFGLRLELATIQGWRAIAVSGNQGLNDRADIRSCPVCLIPASALPPLYPRNCAPSQGGKSAIKPLSPPPFSRTVDDLGITRMTVRVGSLAKRRSPNT